MRTLFCVVVSLACGSAFGQGGPGWVPGVPYQPQVVNQQVVQQPGQQIVQQAPMVPVPPPGYGGQPYAPPSTLPTQEWRDGLRESFTHSDVHEIRPIKEWENYPHYWQNQQVYAPQYYQPTTYGYPQYQYQYTPQYQYYYPQQQYYCPQQQYYCPQQTRCYYQKPCWMNWFCW